MAVARKPREDEGANATAGVTWLAVGRDTSLIFRRILSVGQPRAYLGRTAGATISTGHDFIHNYSREIGERRSGADGYPGHGSPRVGIRVPIAAGFHPRASSADETTSSIIFFEKGIFAERRWPRGRRWNNVGIF